jgi:hypothetical protein
MVRESGVNETSSSCDAARKYCRPEAENIAAGGAISSLRQTLPQEQRAADFPFWL